MKICTSQGRMAPRLLIVNHFPKDNIVFKHEKLTNYSSPEFNRRLIALTE